MLATVSVYISLWLMGILPLKNLQYEVRQLLARELGPFSFSIYEESAFSIPFGL